MGGRMPHPRIRPLSECIAERRDHAYPTVHVQQSIGDICEPQSSVGIGECHLRTGEDKEGIAYLEQALEIFRRLGMRSDIPRIKARLAELPRPDV